MAEERGVTMVESILEQVVVTGRTTATYSKSRGEGKGGGGGGERKREMEREEVEEEEGEGEGRGRSCEQPLHASLDAEKKGRKRNRRMGYFNYTILLILLLYVQKSYHVCVIIIIKLISRHG